MNFGRSDLRKVQASVLGAVLMLLVAVIVLYVAYQVRDKAQLARVAITAQRSDADGKLKRVRDEEYEIRQKSILSIFQFRYEPERATEWVTR
jgi:ABC-type uncharacterized transport system YnjBCD permease subunit